MGFYVLFHVQVIFLNEKTWGKNIGGEINFRQQWGNITFTQ